MHCNGGKGRSTTVVVAYLMESRGMSAMDALNFVRDRRKVVVPPHPPPLPPSPQTVTTAAVAGYCSSLSIRHDDSSRLPASPTMAHHIFLEMCNLRMSHFEEEHYYTCGIA